MRRPSRHPEHKAYTKGCSQCQEWQRQIRKWKSYQKYHGTPDPRADPEQVELAIAHAERLHRQLGWPLYAIADAVGCHQHSLTRVMKRKNKHPPRRYLVEAILKIDPGQFRPNPNSLISVVPTVRRLRACLCDGWSSRLIADSAGCDVNLVREWRRQAHPHISIHHAQRIREVTEELRCLPPPQGVRALRAAREAAKHHYLPWEAWPDSTIDDPDAEPVLNDDRLVDQVAVQRVRATRRGWGTLNPGEQQHLFQLELSAGLTADQFRTKYRVHRSVIAKLSEAYAQPEGAQSA